MKEPEKELTINGHKYVLAETEKAPEPTWDSINKWWQTKHMDRGHLHRQHQACVKLAITAKYLNGDWVPSDEKDNYYPYLDGVAIHVHYADYLFYSGRVFFKDKATVLKAIEILGEDVVKQALMFGA